MQKLSGTVYIMIGILICISVFELFLLIRHEFFKNALIERGFLRQKFEERSDYNCTLGWTNTLQKLHVKADICFIGNSLIYGSDFQKDYPNLIIVNLGYSGDMIEGMIFRLGQISAVNPDKIFVMAGSNDLKKKYMSIDRFRNIYNELVDSVLKNNPSSELYLQSLLPVNHSMNPDLYSTDQIIKANSIIREIAKQRSLIFIDLFSLYADDELELPKEHTYDGVHLYPTSYDLWSSELRQYLLK